MRRFEKSKHIHNLNMKLNNKKNSLAENHMPGGGAEREYFDYILQGSEASEENAMEHAKYFEWSNLDKTVQKLPNLSYVDTVDGVEIYYDRAADYYAFAPEGGEMVDFDADPYADYSDETRADMEKVDHQEYLDRDGGWYYDEEGEMEESKQKSFNLLNEGTTTMFEKLCGVKVIKEGFLPDGSSSDDDIVYAIPNDLDERCSNLFNFRGKYIAPVGGSNLNGRTVVKQVCEVIKGNNGYQKGEAVSIRETAIECFGDAVGKLEMVYGDGSQQIPKTRVRNPDTNRMEDNPNFDRNQISYQLMRI
jgi:hypothetical protein